MSKFWRQARFGKGYSPNKVEPDDSELIWPDSHAGMEEEEKEIDPTIDVVDLMNYDPDPPYRPRGGYRAQTWRDDWLDQK